MSPLRAARVLWGDLAALLPGPRARLWFVLLGALLLQIGFWYLASPGPTLLRFAPRDLPHALQSILWSLALLVALPALLLGAVGVPLSSVGLRLGDARYGLAVAAVGVVVAVPLMALGSGDPGLQATYPWAGAWVGRSWGTLATWVALYALYYLAFEFFYRGVLQNVVAEAWGDSQGIWLQTVASTLVHLGKPMTEVLAAVPAGLLFGVVAARSRSILPSFLVHLVIGVSIDVFVLAHQGLLLPR